MAPEKKTYKKQKFVWPTLTEQKPMIETFLTEVADGTVKIQENGKSVRYPSNPTTDQLERKNFINKLLEAGYLSVNSQHKISATIAYTTFCEKQAKEGATELKEFLNALDAALPEVQAPKVKYDRTLAAAAVEELKQVREAFKNTEPTEEDQKNWKHVQIDKREEIPVYINGKDPKTGLVNRVIATNDDGENQMQKNPNFGKIGLNMSALGHIDAKIRTLSAALAPGKVEELKVGEQRAKQEELAAYQEMRKDANKGYVTASNEREKAAKKAAKAAAKTENVPA